MSEIPLPPGRILIACLIACLVVLLGGEAAGAQDSAAVPAPLRERAVAVLRDAMADQERWVKVHAAEALLALDYRDGVRGTFLKELEAFGDDPEYRIGIWRVLERTDLSARTTRRQWLDKIVAAFEDEQGPGRTHASETLGKLGYTFDPADDRAAAPWLAFDERGPDKNSALARWVLLNSGAEGAEARLVDLLDSDQEMGAGLAAYALRFRDAVSRETWDKLVRRAFEVPDPDRVYLLSAALKHAPPGEDGATGDLRVALVELAGAGTKDQRYEACTALGESGGPGDVALLAGLLDDQAVSPDVKVAAAKAICRIGRRGGEMLAALDWVVIALYAAGMIGVGWFYARRTRSTDDYLLGGRNMRSWAVGLSLFATLLSTISYLAFPGELIRHGPMIVTEFIVYPIIFVVVAWFMIPFFMRLRITTAYEILEKRFGVSVRLFGSFIFLLLRLLWMATIVYVTAGTVLVPTLGIDESWTPFICAILAVVTIVYTSMGGLRAVVATDVAQTAILLAGALLAIALITVHFGGFGWWPDGYQVHWQEPVWGFHPGARLSFVGLAMSAVLWYVCTAGSDQMAIQRYLSTRDTPAAQRLFLVNLCTGATVLIVLALLGFALLAYFSRNPHLLADGQGMMTHADKLLPRYIVAVLPPGISGLLVAALLAAAMSSLSSGVNSASSVIVIDFVDRFRAREMAERTHISLARWMSVLVGIVVVGISLYVSLVEGNIVEIAYRVVNLFTVPLFILFFMALYVRWATTFGTWVGGLTSAAVAVAIAYWDGLGLDTLTGVETVSFVWILPAAMVAGVVAGPVASLLPIGHAKPMLSREPAAGED